MHQIGIYYLRGPKVGGGGGIGKVGGQLPTKYIT